MSVTDELLKLKTLHDSGAISNDEFETMKKKLLNGDLSNSSNQTHSNINNVAEETSSTTRTYSKKYFNEKPFQITGWICIAINLIFALIIMILLIEVEEEIAMALVWEFSFLPATISIIMGGIVKAKSYKNSLLVFSIIGMMFAIAICIATIILYNEAISYSPYRYYYTSAING